jgi:signal transduction histidine kinase
MKAAASRKLRLGTKILLPTTALFVGSAILVIAGFSRMYSANIEASIDESLHTDGHLVRELIRAQEQQLTMRTRLLADMLNLSESYGSTSVGRSALIYLLQYLRDDGVAAEVYRSPAAAGTDYHALLGKGFLGVRSTTLVLRHDEEGPALELASVAPVETVVGVTRVTLTTSRLDLSFLEELERRVGDDLTLVHAGQNLASTLEDPACGAALAEMSLVRPEGERSGDDGARLETLECADGPHRVLLRPLEVGFGGEARYALSVPLTPLVRAKGRIWRNTLLAAGLALALALLIYSLLVRRITRPLQDLSDLTRDVAAGNLERRAAIVSGDEVGELGASFNTMVERLEESRREIEMLHQREMQRADRLASIGELASGVAHEIRNPLTGISGAIHVLRDEGSFAAGHGGILDEVLRQIDRMEQLTKDLLSYSRPAPPQPEPSSLNGILDEVLTLLGSVCMRSGIRIVKDYDEGLPTVTVDPRQVQQVFLNIILNATQAMTKGGEIRVGTELRSDNEHRRARVTIADSGPGMSPETLDRALDPFYTTKHRGTGLGLAIAKQIMDSHRGSLIVESREGEGTTMSLEFPLDDA